MTISMANLRSRRTLAGVTLTAACIAVSVPAATAATTAARPAVPSCATNQVKAAMGSSDGTAGAVYTSVDFTNVSALTCTLYGYPGISLADGAPYTQIGQSAGWNAASAPTLITLAPGATASAVLKIADAYNFPSGSCDPTPTSYVVVYPPNTGTPIHLKYSAITCADRATQTMTVNSVRSGLAGD